jgi:hypothetical protein
MGDVVVVVVVVGYDVCPGGGGVTIQELAFSRIQIAHRNFGIRKGVLPHC